MRDNGLPIIAVIIAAIGLTIGWQLFARRMMGRTVRAEESAEEVAKIWGGPLHQPQPKIRWRRVDAATVELTQGELAKSSVEVTLDAKYRRRGITEYPGYEAEFTGNYGFRNPSVSPISVAFNVGLPVDRSALMLTDLQLLVDGVEDRARTEYAQEGMSWAGELTGGRDVVFTVKYRARGLQRFVYALGSGADSAKPVSKFDMTMIVRGVPGELDYPIGAMSPGAIEEIEGGKKLAWRVENLLSSFDIGIVLPDRSGVTRALQKLIFNAPFFFLLYAVGILYALSRVGSRARAVHVFALAGGYFLFFPLATYLTAYVAWPVACVIALAGVSLLAIAHAMRFVGFAPGVWVAACQIFFLAVPSAAHLLPSHTGLILVIASFVGLAIVMHALGRAAKKISEDDEPSPAGAFGEVGS